MKASCTLSVLILLWVIMSGCRHEPSALKVGDIPPAFAPSDLEGKRVKIPGDFRGKVVAIRFWASTCPACAQEMPEIEGIYHKFKEKGFVILAVNVAQKENIIRDFISQYSISYPVLLDPYATIANEYGVIGFPTTFVLDRSGVIRYINIGPTNGKAFSEMILHLL